MAVLPIIIAPDERLKQVSEPVEKITEETLQLIEDLLDTMYAANGIGLSAVQVGVHQRVIVVDVDWDSPRYQDGEGEASAPSARREKALRMINPEIIEHSEEVSPYNEGCLSFPGQYSEVVRPSTIKVRYQNEKGEEQVLEADELLATCIQHEIDHMNGIVFVDHISRLKRDMILRKLKKAQK